MKAKGLKGNRWLERPQHSFHDEILLLLVIIFLKFGLFFILFSLFICLFSIFVFSCFVLVLEFLFNIVSFVGRLQGQRKEAGDKEMCRIGMYDVLFTKNQ